MRERLSGIDDAVRRRLDVLFAPNNNAWGALYDALVMRQPLYDPDLALFPLLARKRAAFADRIFDVGVHIRHRQHQP